jgi:hypothetical protein
MRSKGYGTDAYVAHSTQVSTASRHPDGRVGFDLDYCSVSNEVETLLMLSSTMVLISLNKTIETMTAKTTITMYSSIV